MDPRLNIISKMLADVKRVIAVSGGKGGIGKSITATTLALNLIRRNRKVGLLDLDLCGPSAHVILGVNQICPEEEKGIIPPEVFGLKFMSIVHFTGDNPSPLRGADVSNVIIELLAITRWGDLDFLIIDMPPGLSDSMFDVVRLIKKVEFLLVTTHSKMALAAVKKELQVLKEHGMPVIGVLRNMNRAGCIPIEQEAGNFSVPVIGVTDFDEKLENVIGNVPELLKTGFVQQMEQMANMLCAD